MTRQRFALAADRGGHWHNAKMLLEQLQVRPDWIVTTWGPEAESVRALCAKLVMLPYLFSWFGKYRFLNPLKVAFQVMASCYWAVRYRPRIVVSTGASNVVPFCYFAWALGARIYHVECMNQVETPSITGRLLYPICSKLYVQWPELIRHYGRRAQYAGWVL